MSSIDDIEDIIAPRADYVDVSSNPETEQGPHWSSLHEAACAAGERFYTDPSTGLMVMTEVLHRERGKCCGSGCRHCPYAHERVRPDRRVSRITQPAFLSESTTKQHDSPCVVLFWSTGKDSFLALRALRRGGGGPVVLMTTFDADTRNIANQETALEDAVRQAQALRVPLVGVPLHRGGPAYSESIRKALDLVARKYHGGVEALAFGDLHLQHIREWREQTFGRRGAEGYKLLFPLWNVPYENLLHDLEDSRVPCRVSAVTAQAGGAVKEGEVFDRGLAQRAADGGIDAFGENGEFHTLACVWEVQGS